MTRPEDLTAIREHQKEVLMSMIDLFDSLLTNEAKREVLAFLAASLGVQIKDPPTTPRGG